MRVERYSVCWREVATNASECQTKNESTDYIVAHLNRRPKTAIDTLSPEDPLYDPEEIYGIIQKDIRKPYDVREIIARIVDGSRLHEFKRLYGDTLVTGFERVIMESMRLYPPVPGIGRKAIEPCTIGDYEIPKGTSFEIMQWVVHRDPRWFDEPEVFNPDRWENDLEKRLPKCAYFPFGAGPRVCIGQRFAMMEAVLVLASIAVEFRFRLVPDHPVEPFASIALRPAQGIKAVLGAR